jgi:hypothetical protein
MDVYVSSIHSFIVKLWLEPSADKYSQDTWRGNITHVPDGRRQYLRELDDITDFIEPYIEEMNVKVRKRGLFGRWLRRWGRHKARARSSG